MPLVSASLVPTAEPAATATCTVALSRPVPRSGRGSAQVRYRALAALAPPAPGARSSANPGDQAIRFNGASPRAIRWMFSAITAARESIIPSVHPETCGVISTFGSVWKGRWAGVVGASPEG